MKIIYDKPRTGKTTELIRRCAENGGYIVCQDNLHKIKVMQMAQRMKLKIPTPFTFDEFIRGNKIHGVRKIYIDNADKLLRQIALGIEVDSIVIDMTEE